jgi:hypothetical protein
MRAARKRQSQAEKGHWVQLSPDIPQPDIWQGGNVITRTSQSPARMRSWTAAQRLATVSFRCLSSSSLGFPTQRHFLGHRQVLRVLNVVAGSGRLGPLLLGLPAQRSKPPDLAAEKSPVDQRERDRQVKPRAVGNAGRPRRQGLLRDPAARRESQVDPEQLGWHRSQPTIDDIDETFKIRTALAEGGARQMPPET